MNIPVLATPTQTMSSREIADLTGKEHRNVMRDIRVMLVELHGEGGVLSFEQTYTNPQNGQSYPCYALPKRETLILVSGYSVAMRAKIIDRWQELEAKQTAFDITNPVHLLQAIEVQARLNIQLAAERDHAIATKAQIGSKREATAMNTAAQAVREKKAIEAKLGRCINHASILAVQNATGASYAWHPLKAYCSKNGLPQVKAHDDRWGKVNTYPAQAWLAVYGVDIVALFGEVAA